MPGCWSSIAAGSRWRITIFAICPRSCGPGDCLVLNDTRVVPARLLGRRDSTGGHWEGLFLEVGGWRPVADPLQGAGKARARRDDSPYQRPGAGRHSTPPGRQAGRRQLDRAPRERRGDLRLAGTCRAGSPAALHSQGRDGGGRSPAISDGLRPLAGGRRRADRRPALQRIAARAAWRKIGSSFAR